MAAFGETDLQPARHLAFLRIPAPGAAGADAYQVHRAVADVMVTVAAEVLRRELPVAGDEPFLNTTQDLSPPFAPVPGVERQVQVELEIAQVFQKRRRRRV